MEGGTKQMMFTKAWFFDLEQRLIDAKLDADNEKFDVIKKRLSNPQKMNADKFAAQTIYVILAGGFSQKTAKIVYGKIIKYLVGACGPHPRRRLLSMFNNENKIFAIIKVWENRQKYRDEYYALTDLDSKILYLQTLPHIGKITANHLARNLGEDVVKYDIWIQRLGVAFIGHKAYGIRHKINNAKLDQEIKQCCDDMFLHMVQETGLPRGYIDVVIWKACQVGLIKL
jgi:hypothetical protein